MWLNRFKVHDILVMFVGDKFGLAKFKTYVA